MRSESLIESLLVIGASLIPVPVPASTTVRELGLTFVLNVRVVPVRIIGGVSNDLGPRIGKKDSVLSSNGVSVAAFLLTVVIAAGLVPDFVLEAVRLRLKGEIEKEKERKNLKKKNHSTPPVSSFP